MTKKIIFTLLTLSLIGCYSIPKHLISDYGNFSHRDKDKLRIDGYYYRIDSARFGGEKHKPEIRWIVLYENGTLLQSFQLISEFNGFESFENDIFNKPLAGYDYSNNEKNNIWWGAYSINDSLINFQYFEFFNSWVAIERKGVIVNDTTIKMTSSKSLNGYNKNCASKDYGTFHFRYFENKPDSLNWMMTDKYFQNKINSWNMSD